MKQTFEIEGLKETEAVLGALGKSLGKALLRRVLKKWGQPIADAASANATKRSGELAETAAVSSKLSDRQRKLHRRMFRRNPHTAEMHVGFGKVPQAHLEEFGSVHNAPNPALRSAWDRYKGDLPEKIGGDLWDEIEKTVARKRKRDAKKAAGG